MIFSIIRLGFCALLLGGCSTFVDYPIGVPPRPVLISLSAEMQQEIPADSLDIIAVNDASLKIHIQKLEARIRLHDDAL